MITRASRRGTGEAENVRFSVENENPPAAWQCACYEFWEKSKISLEYGVIRTAKTVDHRYFNDRMSEIGLASPGLNYELNC
jgi:hypothetical protein